MPTWCINAPYTHLFPRDISFSPTLQATAQTKAAPVPINGYRGCLWSFSRAKPVSECDRPEERRPGAFANLGSRGSSPGRRRHRPYSLSIKPGTDPPGLSIHRPVSSALRSSSGHPGCFPTAPLRFGLRRRFRGRYRRRYRPPGRCCHGRC